MIFKTYIFTRLSRTLFALFFIFFAFLSFPTTRCIAADSEKDTQIMARKLFKQGLKFYDSRRYAEALDKFQQAYAYKSSYKILYNIGQVQAQLGRTNKALAAMESYISDGGDDIPKKRREKVLKEIDALKKLVGTVIIDGQDGSEAWIDGENAGRLPLNGEIALSAGTHRLVVRFGKNTPCEKVFTVIGATMTTVSCYIDLDAPVEKELNEEPASWQMNARLKALPVTEKKSFESVFLTKVAPWIAVGLTVVLAGAATGTAIKARKINSDLNDNCKDGACDSKYKDQVESLPKLAAATDALFITAGVFAVGATLLFTAPWDKKKGDKNRTVSLRLRGGQL